jgi:DnaJ-class molecular chaperone
MADRAKEIQFPKLETRCPECRGEGGNRDHGHWRECYECHGARTCLTEAGEKVFDVMRHRFDFLLRRAIEDGTLSLGGR